MSMAPPVANTGERILLEKETPLMIARHFCAYRFAQNFCKAKVVLDFGCGEGYGAHFLSLAAKSVIGVDYDEGVIAYARQKYKGGNLQFLTADARKGRFTEDKFDVICNFQVIEHIKEAGVFLKNINRMLRDNGIFICSTPNRLDASPKSNTPLNKFHVKEYLVDEFKGLLEGYFGDIELFGVKRGRKLAFYRRLKKMGLFNCLPQKLDPVKNFYSRIDYDNFVITEDKLALALDFITVCKKSKKT